MKKIAVLLMVAGVCVLGGCGKSTNSVEVLVDEGSFPKSLAGEWVGKCDLATDLEWRITFAPDGQILSVTNPFGNVELKPGVVTRFKTRFGGKGIYEPGKWSVEYSAQRRELAVIIVVKHFHQDMGANVIEGSITDILVGEVSADGQKWTADWSGFPQYTTKTEKYGIKDLSTDPNGESRERVYFEKVKEGKSESKEKK